MPPTHDREVVDLTVTPVVDLTGSDDEIAAYSPVKRSCPVHGPPSTIMRGIELPSNYHQKRSLSMIEGQKIGPPTRQSKHTSPRKEKMLEGNVSMKGPGNLVKEQSEPVMFTYASGRSSTSIKRSRHVEVIEIESDGDDATGRVKKRRKLEDDTDSEEDYAVFHAAFNPDSDRWKQMPLNENKLELIADNLILDHPPDSPPNKRKKYFHPDISDGSEFKWSTSPHLTWNALRSAINANWLRQFSRRFVPLGLSKSRETLEDNLVLSRLQLLTSFKIAPGSINKIEQQGKWTAICSACIGGTQDTNDEQLNPYNRKGSLLVWNGSPITLPGHRREEDRDDGSSSLHSDEANNPEEQDSSKYYAVHDVKFDPHSLTFVSSGTDMQVRVWSLNSSEHYKERCKLFAHLGVPNDLAFKPGTSNLAVAAENLCVYSELDKDSASVIVDLVPRSSARHSVGAVAWGMDASSDLIFASSEPWDSKNLSGYHKAFNLSRRLPAITFDSTEAGDAMALGSSGNILALITRGVDHGNFLRLYDVGRRNGSATFKCRLQPFPSTTDGEINVATLSPDENYLALARNDNHTHIYDMRMMSRGLLYDWEHAGPSRVAPGNESYGIVKAQWVESHTRRLGLVTGGADGCIRLWDPCKASCSYEDSVILAEANSDIAHFSLGDRYKGERELVIGDCTGEVSVYDLRMDR